MKQEPKTNMNNNGAAVAHIFSVISDSFTDGNFEQRFLDAINDVNIPHSEAIAHLENLINKNEVDRNLLLQAIVALKQLE